MALLSYLPDWSKTAEPKKFPQLKPVKHVLNELFDWSIHKIKTFLARDSLQLAVDKNGAS